MNAASLRDAFHADCVRALNLVQQVEEAKAKNGRPIPALQRNLVFETAFLRVLLSWEAFLEDIFLHYLCGRDGVSGRACNPLVEPKSVQVARAVLHGDASYLEWTSREVVLSRAGHWLGTRTYWASGFDKAPDLKHMYRIRNRIAHSSEKSRTDFAATRLHLAPGRPHYRGFGPGMLLRYQRPAGRTIDRLVAQLKNAAVEIAAGP